MITFVNIDLKHNGNLKSVSIRAENVEQNCFIEWIRKGVRFLYEQMEAEFGKTGEGQAYDCEITWAT